MRQNIVMLLIALCFCQPEIASAINVNNLNQKIAFIKDGEIWIINHNGYERNQITDTGGKVGNFLFSPSLEYLAYSKEIKLIDDPGIYEDEEPPKVPVYSIVIVDLSKDKIIKEIIPPLSEGDSWIRLDKWLPGDKLLFYGADGFMVSWFYEYDARKNSFYRDDERKLYKLSKGRDKLGSLVNLLSSSAISDTVVLSPSKLHAAWLKIDNTIDSPTSYSLIIYSYKDNHEKTALSGIAFAGSISWSPDSRYICIFETSEEQDALVVNHESLQIIAKINGSWFRWISDNKLAYEKQSNIYVYELSTRKSSLLLDDAFMPVLLRVEK